MWCCPRAGSFYEIFAALTFRFVVDIIVILSVYQGDWKAQSMHGTISHPISVGHKLRWELQSAQLFFTSCCSLPEAHWGTLKWGTLYWNAILYGLAAISMSQQNATNLVELIFQRLHVISSLMPEKSNKTSFDSPNVIQLPIQDRSLHHTHSLWPFWLSFAHCDYLFSLS